MAIDSFARWQLVRDVIVQRKSGVIVLQTGTNYLNWVIEAGNLVCVSSTFPEASFTRWMEQNKLTESTIFLNAQQQIDSGKSLGAILMRLQHTDPQELARLLFHHWVFCTTYLFDPSAHLFWSSNAARLKPDMVRCDRSLGDVLICASRSSIAIPTALRVLQALTPPYRIQSRVADTSGFSEEERRIWMHLESGNDFKQILRDPEIARIPFYKMIFLLWVSGFISDGRKVAAQKVIPVSATLLQKIPPEWIFPLCIGTLIGVLLAPDSVPEPPPPVTRVRPLEESLQRPAWSQDDEESNTESQGHREDGNQ